MMTRPLIAFYLLMLVVAAVAAIGFEQMEVAKGALGALALVWFGTAFGYCIKQDRKDRKKPHYWT
ncbi:hypothetical protein [Burkholderia gladioli]|uniref:hypothetical protein n=1 Tax=Burkholderia gladioli TaxID=28095 RepID=UPI00163F8FBE|nr:hypothetical protein [Burkholderia gladioli]